MGRLNEQKLQVLLKENKPVVVAVGDGSGLSLQLVPVGNSGTATAANLTG